MRLVGVAHDLGGAAGQRRAEHGFAERRAGGAGAEVVRGPADGDLDLSGVVGVHQLVGHRRAVAAFAEPGAGLEGFDEGPAVGGSVGVQVVEDDEAGAG